MKLTKNLKKQQTLKKQKKEQGWDVTQCVVAHSLSSPHYFGHYVSYSWVMPLSLGWGSIYSWDKGFRIGKKSMNNCKNERIAKATKAHKQGSTD